MPVPTLNKIYPFIPSSPDKYIIEQRKDQFWPARFGHLNYLVDQLNNLVGDINNIFLQLGLIPVTYAEAQQLIQTNTVIEGGQYIVTNAPSTDLGLYVWGTSTNSFSSEGIAGFLVPPYANAVTPNWSTVQTDSGVPFSLYLGAWNMAESNYTTGQVASYNGLNWISTNNTPAFDPLVYPTVVNPFPFYCTQSTYRPDAPGNTKWVQLPKKTTNGYMLEWDAVLYSIPAFGNPSFTVRRDKRRNIIHQNNAGNAFSLFKWGDDSVTRNQVYNDSLINCVNNYTLPGGAVKRGNILLNVLNNNSVIQGADHDGNIFRMSLDNECVIQNLRHAQLFRGFLNTASVFTNITGFDSSSLGKAGFAASLNLFANSQISFVSRPRPFSFFIGFQNLYSSTLTQWAIEQMEGPASTSGNVWQFNSFFGVRFNFRNNYTYQRRGGFYDAIQSGVYSQYYSNSSNTLTGFLNMAGDNTAVIPKVFATGATNVSISDSTAAWTINQFVNYQVVIVSGPGAGQIKLIQSNSATTLVLLSSWDVIPTTASEFIIQNTPARHYTGYTSSAGLNTLVNTENVWRTDKIISTGAASGGTLSSLTDASQTWAVNQFVSFGIQITGGTGAGQVRVIGSNTATDITVTVNWTTAPDATSTYTITAGEFANYEVVIVQGTGAGQMRTITNNNSNTLTLASNWITTPDATSRFIIQGPAYDLITETLKMPYGYAQLGEVWLWNTGGETINTIHDLSAYAYRAGTKFKVLDGTGVTFTNTAKALYPIPTNTATPPGILAPASVTINNQFEYYQVEGIGGYLYMKDSAVFA